MKECHDNAFIISWSELIELLIFGISLLEGRTEFLKPPLYSLTEEKSGTRATKIVLIHYHLS